MHIVYLQPSSFGYPKDLMVKIANPENFHLLLISIKNLQPLCQFITKALFIKYQLINMIAILSLYYFCNYD
jgi:hypothetical protein